LLPYGYVDLWISTFHALGERILRQDGLDIGIDTGFTILDRVGMWRLIRQHLFDFDLDDWRPLGNPTKFIYALGTHFSRLKDENISPQEYMDFVKRMSGQQTLFEPSKLPEEVQKVWELAHAYQKYEEYKAAEGALDFGDLIVRTIQLLTKRTTILDKYRKQFSHILVDEFQDTNWAQYVLIKMLAAPKNNLTVVGDDDQSVYKFRGAAISNILEFKKDFPNACEVVMTQNYRSKQNILDLAYSFIQLNNPNRLEAKLYASQVGEGSGKLIRTPISKKLHSSTRGKGIIEHLHMDTLEDEVLGVVKKMVQLRKKNPKRTWSDFAILVRANDAAIPFMNSLSYHDIPYEFVASQGLFTKPEVMDMISYLKFLDNVHESPSLFRVLSMPALAFPPVDLMRLTQYARRKNISLYDALQQASSIEEMPPKTVTQISRFLEQVAGHMEHAKTRNAGHVLYEFVTESGMIKLLTTNIDRVKAEKILHVNQFFSYIGAFERESAEPTVKNFIVHLQLATEAGDEGSLAGMSEEGPDAVKIMTVHAAKGLEFTYVFMVNLVDKRFPTIERKDPIEIPDGLVKEIILEGNAHLQEERRLFYVGITRAREGIFFTSAEDYGGARKKKPSQFLFDISLQSKATGKRKASPKRALSERYPEPVGTQTVQAPVGVIPRKFSFTQLKAFETCPYQYRFAHILKVPVRGKGVFSFGKSMHQTLKDFYALVKKRVEAADSEKTAPGVSIVTLQELLELYEHNWIDEWYDSPEHMAARKTEGKDLLESFYALQQTRLNAPKYLEQPFNIRVGDYTLKGVIDRVDLLKKGEHGKPDEVEIVDYKTGRVPKSEKDADIEQLLIYAIASREVLHDDPKRLTYYFLDDNQRFSYEPTEGAIKETRERIVETIDQILTSNFPATPSAHICKSCDFRDICEYRIL
ncbi:MAG: 3'-5' exonuclease, partial [Patescibacteria group bacterium]